MRKKARKKTWIKKDPGKSNSVTFSKLTFHKLDWLEKITIGLSIWFFIYPSPYIILFSILVAIPVLGLLLNGLHKPSMASLVEISLDKDGNDKYDVADFIDIAAWVILFRVFVDYEFESFYSMIIPGTIACLIVIAILFLTHKQIENSTRNKGWIYTSLIFSVSLYSYAATYGANCVYDFSEPEVYKAKVTGKRISHGKSRTYYLRITPWGHHFDEEEIKVSMIHYSETEVGETVTLDLKKGLFNIPWYYIERNRKE